MKFIQERDKKILFTIFAVILIAWLIWLTYEVKRIDDNFNGYLDTVVQQNKNK